MRHCYSTGDELLLANNVCKPLLAKQLGCFKIYVFDRKFWLLYWKFQFLLSAGDEHFLNKPENSNSKIGREVGLSCFRSPFSPSVPYPGLVEGEALRGVRTGKKQQLARLQKCCKLGGGGRGLQCRSLQKREKGLRTVGHHLWCSTSKEGQEVSLSKQMQAKSFLEAERGH